MHPHLPITLAAATLLLPLLAPANQITQADLEWLTALGAVGSITVADNKIFVGANNDTPIVYKSTTPQPTTIIPGGTTAPPSGNSLVCLDLETGQLLWRSEHPPVPDRRFGIPHSPVTSTTAVAGDRAYYLSTNWQFVCVDTEGFLDDENDGPFIIEPDTSRTAADTVWSIDLITGLGAVPRAPGDVGYLQSSPAIIGDTVFLVTGNGVETRGNTLIAPQAPTFIAVDRHTGKIRWQKPLPGNRSGWFQNGSPVAYQNNILFPGGNGHLYLHAATDGTLLAEIDLHAAGKTKTVFPTNRPAISGHTIVTALGLPMESANDHTAPLLAIKADRLTHDGSPGALIWSYQPPQTGIRGAPIISGDSVFVTSNPNLLTALDLNTGSQKWRRTLGGESDRLLAYNAPTVVGDHLYITSEDGVLYQLAIRDQGKTTHAWEFPGIHSEHANPIPVVGGLIIATRDTVFRLKVPTN